MASVDTNFAVKQTVESITLPQGIAYEPSPTDQATAQRMRDWFQRAWDADTKNRTATEEDFKFYNSEQWDEAVKKQLEDQRRPALTINRIKKQVQVVVGFEKQNRLDIVARPRGEEATDTELASLMTDLIKFVHDTGMTEHELSRAFEEGLVGGRGWLMPRITYDDDPVNGEPRFDWISWREMLPDPAATGYGRLDGQYMIRHRWLSRWQLEDLYPHKKAAIARAAIMAAGEREAAGQPSLFYDPKGEVFRVIETWWRKPRQVRYVVDPDSGTLSPMSGAAGTQAALQEKLPQLRFVTRTVQDIRVTVTLGVGGVVLEDKPTPYEKEPLSRMFPFIPYVADETDGKPRGIVRDLKDPQRETNKRRSQYLHLINVAAVPGWIGDEGAVANPASFEELVTRPGFVVWKRPNRELARQDPARLPVEFFKLDDETRQDMFDIGNNPDVLGVESSAASDRTSGRAIMLRQQTGQVVLGTYFDNLRMTRRLLGIWTIGLIQQTFTDQKVIRLTGTRGADKIARLNQVSPIGPVNIVTDMRTGEMKSLGDYRDLRFDIVITENPAAPSTRLAQLAILTDLMNGGAFQNPMLADFIMELAGFDPDTRQRVVQSLVPVALPTAGAPSGGGAGTPPSAAPPA